MKTPSLWRLRNAGAPNALADDEVSARPDFPAPQRPISPVRLLLKSTPPHRSQRHPFLAHASLSWYSVSRTRSLKSNLLMLQHQMPAVSPASVAFEHPLSISFHVTRNRRRRYVRCARALPLLPIALLRLSRTPPFARAYAAASEQLMLPRAALPAPRRVGHNSETAAPAATTRIVARRSNVTSALVRRRQRCGGISGHSATVASRVSFSSFIGIISVVSSIVQLRTQRPRHRQRRRH